MSRKYCQYVVLFATLLLAACQTQTMTQAAATKPSPTLTVPPAPTIPPAPTAPPTPTVPSVMLPTPNYLQSDAEVFTAEMDQLFALRQDQVVQIPTEKLTITHTVDIEFECPDRDEVSCEVPLIATDYFAVSQKGQLLGIQPWRPEMVFDNYKLVTGRTYSGYDYREHQFEIILFVEKVTAAQTKQQTREANPALPAITTNCIASSGNTISQYIAGQTSTPEVHMLSVIKPMKPNKVIDVYVTRSAAPIILVLSAQESTNWQLHLAENVSLSRVILNGEEPHTVAGAENVQIIDRSGRDNYIVNKPAEWAVSELLYQNGLAPDWIYLIEALAGAPLASFTGCYKASEFTIR